MNARAMGGMVALVAGLTAGPHAARAQLYSGNEDEVRALVSEMLADATERSSLLAGGAGGYDGGFFLASEDGAFRLNISGFVQFRYVASFRDEDNTVGANAGDDFEPGFQTRRTKVGFAGQISKDWSFNVLTNVSRSMGTLGLQDAYVDHAFNANWKLRLGQAKLPLLREELVQDQRQLTAERSLVNSAFTQDRSQFVQLSYEGDPITFRVAFSDGLNSDNTEFTTPEGGGFIIGGEADWALTARVEALLSGQAKQFADFTAETGGPLGVLLGAAVHYQQSPNTDALGDTDRSTLEYTVDLSLEGDGWNAFGAFIGRNDDFRAAGSDTDFNDFGVIAQAGLRLGPKWEPFVRYEAIILDDDRGVDEDTHNFITAGVNHYIAGHALKVTADAIFSFEETADLVSVGILPDTGVGLLGTSEDSEVTVRLQFQLLF